MKRIKTCLLFLLATLSLGSFSIFKNATFATADETVTTTIHSCPKCFNEADGGRLFRILIPTGTVYNEVLTGKVYDNKSNSYDVTLTDVGSVKVDEVTYRQVNAKIMTRIPHIIFMNTVSFVNSNETKTLKFEKSYIIYYPSQEYSAGTVEEYKGEVTTKAIKPFSCIKCFTDRNGIEGRCFRFLVTGEISYQESFTGKVLTSYDKEVSATITDIGSQTVEGTSYRMINLVIQEHLKYIVLDKTLKFKNAEETKIVCFDSNYLVTYPDIEETPGKLEDYDGTLILTISSSIKACNVAESFAKRWFDFSIPGGTVYNEVYTGYIYDVNGTRYDAQLLDEGNDGKGGRYLRFALPIRLDVMCIYSSTIFKTDSNKMVRFDFDYKVTYPAVEYTPATYETFNRPYDLDLVNNVLEGSHDFASLEYTGEIYYKENDVIPSYVSTLAITLVKDKEENKNTKVFVTFTPSGNVDEFVIKRKTIFSTIDGKNNFRVDQDYLLQISGGSCLVTPYVLDNAKLKIGNTGNGCSWATAPLDASQDPYKALISFTDSILTGLYESNEKNVYYSGTVYDVNDNEYQARLWLINPSNIVDITNFKLGLYVACSETTIKIKKDAIFTVEGVSAYSKHISFNNDYLITYTANTSQVDVTVLGAGGGGQTTDVPPVITYNGATTLYLKAGKCVPLVFASAKDYFNADVLVKRIYSEGTHDENYHLLKGNHTLTLRADDKYGNSSSIVINLIVE